MSSKCYFNKEIINLFYQTQLCCVKLILHAEHTAKRSSFNCME